jgi:hypothetical protein
MKIRMGACLAEIKWCLRSYKGDFKIVPADMSKVDLLVKQYTEALPFGKQNFSLFFFSL